MKYVLLAACSFLLACGDSESVEMGEDWDRVVAKLERHPEYYDSGFHRTALTDPLLLVRPNLDLIPADKRALVAFLQTLSDPQFQAP